METEMNPQTDLILYFWIDENCCSLEEFLDLYKTAFMNSARQRHRLFKVLDVPTFKDYIYLSLN